MQCTENATGTHLLHPVPRRFPDALLPGDARVAEQFGVVAERHDELLAVAVRLAHHAVPLVLAGAGAAGRRVQEDGQQRERRDGAGQGGVPLGLLHVLLSSSCHIVSRE